MSEKLQLPLPHEIVKARKGLKRLFNEHAENATAMRIMSCWEGDGWHKSEVFLGVLVGLRIAQNRAKRTR